MYIIIERSSFPIDFSALREIEKERKRGLGVLRCVIYVSGKVPMLLDVSDGRELDIYILWVPRGRGPKRSFWFYYQNLI